VPPTDGSMLMVGSMCGIVELVAGQISGGCDSADETTASASAMLEMQATSRTPRVRMTAVDIRRSCRRGARDPGPRQYRATAAPAPQLSADGSYSERGLLGLAISPTFSTDRYVYAFYSDADYKTQHVIRWYDCDGTGIHPTIIATFPAGNDCCHKGGRIAFGPDGKLYVTLGDEHDAPSAQNVGDVRGKVLRYNPDGTVPADNPFGRTNPVWAYGLRNPFGIAFSPTGQLAITMNGPSGDAGSPGTGYDTLYLNVARGAHFQWPDCYGYSHPLAASTCGGGIAPSPTASARNRTSSRRRSGVRRRSGAGSA